jgi:site-specific DNA-methyltransferase (adenine-specific)
MIEIKSEIDKHVIIQGDCSEIMESFDDNYYDLIIADPPYWKVIGEEWDYKWRTEEDYLLWSEIWLKIAYNKLRIGGSFYLFGYFRMLSFIMPILKKIGFELRQQIIVDKGIKSVAGRATKNYKMFPNTTESILFLIKDNKPFTKNMLLQCQKKLNLTSKEINEQLGVKSNGGGMWSIYTGDNICEQFPTKELWEKMSEILKFDLPYESVAQTYNPQMGLTDVWTDIDFYSEERIHPTQKPIKLIRRLIVASTNENNKVLDPFGGSGSTLIACENLNRVATIIEINSEYIEKIESRYHDCKNPLFDSN